MRLVLSIAFEILQSWSETGELPPPEEVLAAHLAYLTDDQRAVHDAFDVDADDPAAITAALVDEAGFDGARAAAIVRAALEDADADD